MDIDIVLTWVDNEDPDWQAAYHQWLPANTEGLDVSEPRYRNWHLLRYWFRGVEQFAPWVRKIHFVTNGQLPSWLNTEHPKLHIVKHSDIMPPEALPTFNSNAIEMNIHKIDGLSENFVYFNDDVFIVGDIGPEYFFTNGLPNDVAVTWFRNRQGGIMRDIVNNNLQIINKRFDKYAVILRHFTRWFRPSYDLHWLRDNLIALLNPQFAGFIDPHIALPIQKHTIEEVSQTYHSELAATTNHRFRSSADISPWLFRYWRLCKGDFTPKWKNRQSRYYNNVEQQLPQIKKDIAKGLSKIVVFNDIAIYKEYEDLSNEITQLFKKLFPHICNFENKESLRTSDS